MRADEKLVGKSNGVVWCVRRMIISITNSCSICILYAIDLVRLSELSICHRIMHNQITNERSRMCGSLCAIPFQNRFRHDTEIENVVGWNWLWSTKAEWNNKKNNNSNQISYSFDKFYLFSIYTHHSILLRQRKWNRIESWPSPSLSSMMMSKMSPLRFGPKLTHCKPNETIYVLFFRRFLLLILLFFCFLIQ